MSSRPMSALLFAYARSMNGKAGRYGLTQLTRQCNIPYERLHGVLLWLRTQPAEPSREEIAEIAATFRHREWRALCQWLAAWAEVHAGGQG